MTEAEEEYKLLFLIRCMNDPKICNFAWETDRPERNVNKECPKCCGINLRVSVVKE